MDFQSLCWTISCGCSAKCFHFRHQTDYIFEFLAADVHCSQTVFKKCPKCNVVFKLVILSRYMQLINLKKFPLLTIFSSNVIVKNVR